MKRLFACLATLFCALPVSASTDLAAQWEAEAVSLGAETSALILTIDKGGDPVLEDTLALDIYRFGRTSSALSKWIDTSDGPKDLGCIFRGMAAEAEVQLDAFDQATTPVDKRESLRRLATMFADAEMIAGAAKHRHATPGLRTAKPTASCAADPAQYLRARRQSLPD